MANDVSTLVLLPCPPPPPSPPLNLPPRPKVNAVNNKGNTALHFASAYGFTKLAQYMISKGADQHATNFAGKRPGEGL